MTDDRFTTADLQRRGFRFNPNIQGFWGYCGSCCTYRLHSWWQSPDPERQQVVVCDQCHVVDHRDDAVVQRYRSSEVARCL